MLSERGDLFASDEDEKPLPSFKKLENAPKRERASKSLISGGVERKRKQKSEKRKKRERKPDDREEEREQRELSPEAAKKMEANKDIDRIVNTIKSVNRARRMELVDEVEMDEQASFLVEQMKAAAFSDVKSNNEGKPALEKLQLLPTVSLQLQKVVWFPAFLEGGILSSIKSWYSYLIKRLEPLPDGSLPALDIQEEMLKVLDKMPIETHQ